MNAQTTLISARFFRATAALVLATAFFAGCAKAQHEKAIKQRYADGVGAICKDDFATFKQIIDPASAKDEGKTKLTWGVIRLMVTLGQLRADDFRVDEIQLTQDNASASVFTSHREKGVWKKGDKPALWILSDGTWHWKL
ncbi:MAG: hypothetical protein EXS24_04540 [Pedosphaera sp.]|nr:hypothetical protein [Pedosphaera sp.]